MELAPLPVMFIVAPRPLGISEGVVEMPVAGTSVKALACGGDNAE